MVLYRKYRPQKLSELDNEEVRFRLIRIFSSNCPPHAFLFAGPKGTGKTSAARIVAKVLNCERSQKSKVIPIQSGQKSKEPTTHNPQPTTNNIEPCNSCETCLSITEGRHLDILEIDAASNRGIEEIRDLREKIKLTPVSAKYKVYIIDEVHMLTNEAFNALLKTLEEPPAHAVFILATTEPERLPATIISRCIRFNFNKASISEIVHCLKRVVAGEKISVTHEVLNLIAGTSDGSFRDATKILEQAILEDALKKDRLTKLLGREAETSEKFLRLLAKREVREILTQMTKMSRDGINFRFLVEDMLFCLHAILLAQHGIEEDKVANDLPKILPKEDVLSLIRLLSRVYIELRDTSMPHLPLEVAAVEWCENKGEALSVKR